MIQLMGGATSQEGYTNILTRLQKTIGDIVVIEQNHPVLDMDDEKQTDPEFNREALHALMGRSPPTKDKSVVTEG